jgi:hypothetical protein
MTDSTELHPELEPPEGTTVQTGEEEIPSTEGGKHDDHLKAIYKKGRENRELVTRTDEDENPDAEMVARMIAETQDEGEFEHSQVDAINLDERKARSDDGEEELPDPEYAEKRVHDMEAEAASAPEKPAEEPVEEEKTQQHFDYEAKDGKVAVKVEGVDYLVPEADIQDAGGVKQYQMNRAANIRFQKAATYAKALQKEKEELAQQQQGSSADRGLPEKDDLSKAELVKTYREKLLDAALDGTEADVDNLLKEVLETSKQEPSEPQNSPGSEVKSAAEIAVEDYEASYALDRVQANALMGKDYADIMDNEELRKIAASKYLEIEANPASKGRTAVEMAREAGDFVRNITRGAPRAKRQETELAARREKKRVLPRQSEAHSRSQPPETKKPRSNRDYIRALQRQQGNRR